MKWLLYCIVKPCILITQLLNFWPALLSRTAFRVVSSHQKNAKNAKITIRTRLWRHISINIFWFNMTNWNFTETKIYQQLYDSISYLNQLFVIFNNILWVLNIRYWMFISYQILNAWFITFNWIVSLSQIRRNVFLTFKREAMLNILIFPSIVKCLLVD